MLLSSATRSGGELWLPEPAIERIQYFLNTKEAAQTTIISKSWYNVWLLRPNIDFDHSDHITTKYSHDLSPEENDQIYHEEMEQFLEFADTTLNKFEESNLKIRSFKLCMNWGDSAYVVSHTELILRALKIGATHLSFHLSYGFGFVLPDEVFETAEILTVIRCNINPKPKLLTCSKLLSLSLESFDLKTPDTISHILLSCPLIQNMSLYHISLDKPEDYRYDPDFDGFYDNYPTDDTAYITKPLMHLTTLVLKCVYFDMLFLGDLSSKFPLLKDLTLIMTLKKHQEEIRISSTSLERLFFRLKNKNAYKWWPNPPYKRQRVTLDFPSIRKFTYVGSVIPLMSLESNSIGWESHLSIRRRHKCRRRLTTSWFRRLSDFLTKLRRSRVSLLLHVRSVTSFDYEVGDIQGLPTTEIENLIIDHKELSSLTCYALLDGLFRICHPKFITQCVSKRFRVKKKHIELLGRVLLNEKTTLTRSHFMYGLNHLKEARAQIFIGKASVSSWRDVSLDVLLQHLKGVKGKQEVRFQLNWLPTTTRQNFNMKMCYQKIQEVDNDEVYNPDREKGFSTIEHAKDYCGERVSNTILEESGSCELVSKVKHLLKLLHNGIPESAIVDDANMFSCMLYEVFREPCFVHTLRVAIKEDYNYIIDCAELLSNNYSPTKRVAHMIADWRFKPTLMSLSSDTTNVNTLRIFLSILFGHWSDEGELRELDKRIGKYCFGRKFDFMVRCRYSPLERRNTYR